MGMFKITDIRKQRAAKDQRRQRLRRLLLWGGSAGVLLTLLFLFVVPPVLRSQLEQRLSKELGRKVTVATARLNPLVGSATIEDLHVQDKDGEELLGWSRLHVNVNVAALLWGDLAFDEISLTGLSGRVLVGKDGKLSISDLLERPSAQKVAGKEDKPLSLRAARLHVSGAKFSFEDRSRGAHFLTHLGPLSVNLRDFEVHPERHAPYEFSATTESGERLEWSGTLGVTPFRSSGHLVVSGILLPKYAPYYRPLVNFELLEGRLELQGKYEAVLDAKGPRMVLSGGRVGLDGLVLAKAGTREPVLALRQLAASGIELDSSRSKASVEELAVKGLQAAAVRGKDGRIDLEQMLRPTPSAPVPAVPSVSTAGEDVIQAWIQNFRLSRVRVEGVQLELRDDAARRPVALSVRDLGLRLDGVSLVKGADIAVELSAKLAGSAPVSASGRVGLFPHKADLQWSLEDLPLSGLSPYLEQQLRARLVQGRFFTQGKVHVEVDETGVPDASGTANLELRQLALVDESNGEPIAGLEGLSVSGAEFALKGQSLSVAEIVVRGPSVSVSIGKDGTPNLAGLLREQAPAPAPVQVQSAQAAGKGAAFALSLGKLSIDGGRASFLDQSVKPEVRFSVRDFGGQVSGLDTRANNPAKVSLAGNLEGSGRLLLDGVLYPFGKQSATQLQLGVDGLNLVAFSPYSGKFAGYALSSGRFNLDVKLKLEDRKLESGNVMTLDHFSFGEAVDSPDATKLPVRLAVALLKDRQGRIVVDIPVQGSLDDPEFRIGRVVWRVVGNILTKAATSPFALLGAAFGGGEELSQLPFDAGSISFNSDSLGKLDKLQKALVDRPSLGLSVTGNFDRASDVAALRAQHLEQFVARAVWQTRQAANPNAPTVAQEAVSAAEREQALRALHAAKLALAKGQVPVGPQATPAPAKTSAAAPKEGSPGFFTRVFAFFTGRKPEPAKPAKVAAPVQKGRDPAKPEVAPVLVSLEQIVRELQADMEVGEAELLRLGLDRAQAVERRLQEAGVEAGRINVTAPAAGPARVELQLK